MNILERFKAPTPKFFKRVQVFGASLAAAGGAIQTVSFAPPALLAIGVHAIVAGSVIVIVAKLAVDTTSDDTSSSPQNTNNGKIES